ncbi:MAG: hypothetical protein QOC80_1916 [Frankiaceae bacterium]|nr:hypothetical protein [Frankiaceae bacterium]
MLLPDEDDPEPELPLEPELPPEPEPELLDFSPAGLDEDASDFSAVGAFSLPAFSGDFSPPVAAWLVEVPERESLR